MQSQKDAKIWGVISAFTLGLLREVTGLSDDRLREGTPFDEIGLESLSIMAFTARLEPFFPGLSKTFLFDRRSIEDVCSYLINNYPEPSRQLAEAMGSKSSGAVAAEKDEEWPELTPLADQANLHAAQTTDGIAIIGMHGRFPGADTVEAFWGLLQRGEDAVGEIPAERWSLDGFYEQGTESRQTGRSYSKWGGFLTGVDKFDAQFFGISPRESALMDPQERLFLECAWHAMEHAALLGERADTLLREGRRDVGVFVGVTTNTYQMLGPEHWRMGGSEIPGAMPWSVANRVSYALNFCGPSLAIDTACSSSLVALHHACESLARGECAAAIAGGVNLYLHPVKYIQLCQAQMLSPSGRCHSFGKDADGFVPGEGVGALVLKPLEAARRDGDRILAVIRGSAVNHSGRTNGYTVPNAKSQSQLVTSALSKAALSPTSISYIEAHGTGTKLGDPIELTGLAEALTDGDTARLCGIGSVKSNIGHLESAAGIASVIKVVLQLEHQQMAPSLHSRELNPALGMEMSRFFVPQVPTAWIPDVKENVRRAGVSSFGAGGANAHVIVEEAPSTPDVADCEGVFVFPLSARTSAQLHEQVEKLRGFLEAEPSSFSQSASLARLAYTLQCGRQHMEYRFATVAASLEELLARLSLFIEKESDDADRPDSTVFIGHVRADEETNSFNSDDSLPVMARNWVNGVRINWRGVWPVAPQPCNTPLYPFAKDRHWIPAAAEVSMAGDLLKTNSHQEDETRQFTFNGQEYFLRDHRIFGNSILPATAYLDRCYEIAKQSGLGERVELRNFTWVAPFQMLDQSSASMACTVRHSHDGLAVEFLSPDLSVMYCRGYANALPTVSESRTDSLATIRSRCTQAFDAKRCYPIFESLNMVYGPSFRGLETALLGENEALTEVFLRTEGREQVSPTALDPALLDSIFQSAFVFQAVSSGNTLVSLVPYNVKSICVYGALEARVFVHVRNRLKQSVGSQLFDFIIYSADGRVLLEIEEFNFRNFAAAHHKRPELSVTETQLQVFEPFWAEEPLIDVGSIPVTGTVVLFDSNDDLYQALCTQFPDLKPNLYLVMAGTRFEIKNGNIIEWDPAQHAHLDLIWRMFLDKGALPKQVIFNCARPVSSESMSASWEGLVKLDRVHGIIEIIRSLFQASSVPRFHTHIMFGYDEAENKALGTNSAVGGLLRSVNQETPTVTATVLEYDQGLSNATLATILIKELTHDTQSGVAEIVWKSEHRWVRHLRFANPSKATGVSIPPAVAGDVIVITGGCGAIGQRIAEILARITGVRLVLVGRSVATDSIRNIVAGLTQAGAIAEYCQADCADHDAMAAMLAEVRMRFGPITGILHCAGVLRDAFFIRQTDADWQDVLPVKVMGAYWLDMLTRNDPLRWFVVCSALAGVRGNVGQSYYALANAWLDGFAEQRQADVKLGLRQGSTTAIAWPLWETTAGMQAPKYMVDSLFSNGFSLMSADEGGRVFLDALKDSRPVLIPVKGEPQKVARFFGIASPSVTDKRGVADRISVAEDYKEGGSGALYKTAMPLVSDVEAGVIAYLTEHLAAVTATPLVKMDADVSLETFGLDSILVMELNGRLEKQFPQLSKTVLFEARSLRALAQLLITEHPSDAQNVAAQAAPDEIAAKSPVVTMAEQSIPDSAGYTHEIGSDNGAIAIIGLAGQYPGASTAEAFWEHLAEGRDLVIEVPGRWPLQTENGVYARWGGFLDNFDSFDPLFFGISPRDAERMDPQERLFLQTAWHTLENAGYTPETLSGPRNASAPRKRVGVIVGVMYGEYQMYVADSKQPKRLANSSYASIANRVSFCLDFDGPSFAIDSMCSSSLTSIHLACDQLRSGDCDAVLAGGVNLSLHPYKYRMLCELNFASTDGKCRSFGDGGDGYVPGEGVGAVLLKRLEDAIRDNDHIHAVIRSSDLGHGARTSGYTVPNAAAQADVIRRAFKRSAVPVSRLSYVEAHGTGTGLGDPIEIRSLTKALAHQLSPGQSCPIGSVKSNIGHLEAAAGIAAVTKVLLQLKHRKLAPSLHATILNKNIDFSKTPFFVQKELADWNEASGLPRIAAVSSFGAGGSNAHLVLEEYIQPSNALAAVTSPQIFVFSARSHMQLDAWLRRFVSYLDSELNVSEVKELLGAEGYSSKDVAMTLSTGRRAFRCRVATVASDFSELRDKLQRYLLLSDGEALSGNVAELESFGVFYGEADGLMTAVHERNNKSHLEIQASAWTRGQELEPSESSGLIWRKVPLPGYEFLRTRYWIADEAEPVSDALQEAAPSLTPSDIVDRVARKEMSEEQARVLLLALIESGVDS